MVVVRGVVVFGFVWAVGERLLRNVASSFCFRRFCLVLTLPFLLLLLQLFLQTVRKVVICAALFYFEKTCGSYPQYRDTFLVDGRYLIDKLLEISLDVVRNLKSGYLLK